MSFPHNSAVDNVYLNITIANKTSKKESSAEFSTTYTQHILETPSDYYAAIVKFEIPLQTLPLLVLPLVPRNDLDEYSNSGTISSVGITVTGHRTNFNQLMVGGTINIGGVPVATILSVQNPNTLLVTAPFTVTNSPFTITYTSPEVVNLSTMIVGVCENNQPGSKNGTAPYTPIPAFTANVLMQPTDQTITPNDIRYAYVYSYQTLAIFLNNALRIAWENAGMPGGAGRCPYFSYDPTTQLFNVIMPAAFVNNGTQGWTVCFNNVLRERIPSYQEYESECPAFLYNRNEIITNQFQGVELGPPTPGVNVGYDQYFQIGFPGAVPAIPSDVVYGISQGYQTLDYINSVRKIILVSNTLPIRKEFFPPPNLVNPGASSSIPILADFQINLDNTAGAQRQVALYEAQIYRFIDLISDSPISRLDLQIYWSDQNNNLYPLYLTRDDTATIKLGFFSKALYRNKEQ